MSVTVMANDDAAGAKGRSRPCCTEKQTQAQPVPGQPAIYALLNGKYLFSQFLRDLKTSS